VQRSDFTKLAAAACAAGLAPRAAAAQTAAAASNAPAPSFEGSRDGIRAVIERCRNDASLESDALPRFYEHGGAVENAVVLFHGFTNCPQQFDELAQAFYARGCNVYVPLIPFHGKKDRLTWALENLTVAVLQDASNEAYRLARGLGRRVTALGLSLGGSMALYLAQTQAIDLAVPVAPFLMPIGVPRSIGMLGMRLLNFLPDQYWWWDPRVKENCLPVYAYPGFPSHALAECIFLGNSVFDAAGTAKPLAKACTLVTNQNESAVNDNVARELLAIWTRAGAQTRQVVLSGLGPPRHDIIDPTTFPQGRTLVYPRLEEVVLGP
jgi:carboxylesterase